MNSRSLFPFTRASLSALALLSGVTTASHAQTDTLSASPRVTFGGMIDTYIAWDASRPTARDRQFTTQPARHAEFNVNLASLHANLEAPRFRGRVAVQAGTSVQSNYAGEPAVGTVSGPDVARLLQEAYVGAELTPGLWLDAGVFYSNMGMESWASTDNPTYTRSLVADYSPYYSSGVRLQFAASERIALRVDVVNGWQNISESNSAKAIGTRVDIALDRGVLSWYTFAGDETDGRTRLFTGIGASVTPTPRLRVVAQADVGSEPMPGTDADRATWYGGTLIGRLLLTDAVAVAARLERYADPNQVILSTGVSDGFRGNGASLGVDVAMAGGLQWRTEVRAHRTDAPVFTAGATPSRRNTVLVSSFAVAF